MSHYTVLCITRQPGELDELLAPYDENINVAPRFDPIISSDAHWLIDLDAIPEAAYVKGYHKPDQTVA